MPLSRTDKYGGFLLVWLLAAIGLFLLFNRFASQVWQQTALLSITGMLRVAFYLAFAYTLMGLAGALSLKRKPRLTLTFFVISLLIEIAVAVIYVSRHPLTGNEPLLSALFVMFCCCLTFPVFIFIRQEAEAA